MTDTALIISAIAPVPVDRGKRVFLNGLLEYFVERLGSANVHYAMIGGNPADDDSIPGVVHHLTKPRTATQLLALARCLRDPTYTAQQAMLGSRRLRDEVQDLVTTIAPTIEVYDTIRLGQHAPVSPRAPRRVLYLDDLFSVRYDRMLNFAASHEDVTFDPLGEFSENVPHFLRPIIRHPQVYRPILRMERNRIRERETAAVRDFDVSLLVNSAEVELLRERSGLATVELIHDLLPAVPEPVRQPFSPPELLFLGKLNLPHNDDSICTFLREAMPGVEQRIPGAQLRIVGSGASETLRALAANHPNSVRLHGYVADLDAVFSRATVALAPMRMGSGIKLKMLDAFARGVPVLATSIAVDGIPVAPDGSDGCLICDDVSRWPELIAELADPRRASDMSSAALDFFAKTYGRDVVGAQYDKIFALGDALVELPVPRSPSQSAPSQAILDQAIPSQSVPDQWVAGQPVTRGPGNVR